MGIHLAAGLQVAVKNHVAGRARAILWSTASVLQAAERIRRKLENDPTDQRKFLSEGLYSIDEDSFRAFFLIDAETMLSRLRISGFFGRRP